MPAPVITIIRPQLTPEERAVRLEEFKKATAAFWIEVEKARKKSKGAQNASTVSI